MKWLSFVLFVYGAAMIAMGVEAMSKSMISLYAGGAAGLLAIVGGVVGLKNPKVGYVIGAVGALAPLGRFVPALLKEFKVFPAFVGTVLCAATLICLIVGHFMGQKKAV